MDLSSTYNGELYNSEWYDTNRGICPVGWHIPSNDDWDELLSWVDDDNYVEVEDYSEPYNSPMAGKYLKANNTWTSGRGENTYSFSALPGGNGSGEYFYRAGSNGYWWSASESNNNSAHYLHLDGTTNANNKHDNKSYLFSIRCLQD